MYGMFHQIAQLSEHSFVPALSVNEVGYNHRLSRNVHIRETERAIKFSLKLGNRPMRLGEPIELLTNYGSAYEKIRERRGYGHRNVTQGLPSNSSHSAQLERGFIGRKEAEDSITTETDLGILETQLDFVAEIWDIHSKR